MINRFEQRPKLRNQFKIQQFVNIREKYFEVYLKPYVSTDYIDTQVHRPYITPPLCLYMACMHAGCCTANRENNKKLGSDPLFATKRSEIYLKTRHLRKTSD
jgi:hypothetical protein